MSFCSRRTTRQYSNIFTRPSFSLRFGGFSSRTSIVRNSSTLPRSPLFEALSSHDPSSTAVVHSRSGRTFTYSNLLHDVAAAKERLTQAGNRKIIAGERIAFLAENGYDYVVTLLSILASNAVALPIATSFPNDEIRYILENSSANFFLTTPKFCEKARAILHAEAQAKPLIHVVPKIESGGTSGTEIHLDDGCINDGGLMLYTSGTTSRPKGVVLSTPTVTAQARSLLEAWQYQATDVLLHVLPLHHIHGTVNALYTPLMAGSAIEFAYPFNADAVWRRFAAPFTLDRGDTSEKPITLFTAVPTVYSRLLSTFSELSSDIKTAATKAISPQRLRLNISGSAALPTPIKDAWTKLSQGNVLLERYGMTEVGMALSCGLDFADRVDASVGWPLPSVEVRLVDTETGTVIEAGEELSKEGRLREGEIQLRGPTIFSEYWQNSKATTEEFVDALDGKGQWFKTGDIAVREIIPTAGKSSQAWAKGPMYFIKGRNSVDIIKTGGEKVSALEIERELLALPQVAEAAVFGINSDQWGQKVAAVIVLTTEGKQSGRGGKPWTAMDMRRALKSKLASYKIPQDLKVVDSIPRNAMGKINKKSLAQDIYQIKE